MESTKSDRELIKRADGLYVGLLEEDEIESFEKCIADHVAYRNYEYPGAIMGLAKVKYIGEQ